MRFKSLLKSVFLSYNYYLKSLFRVLRITSIKLVNDVLGLVKLAAVNIILVVVTILVISLNFIL